jgi:hypothetical protein
LYEAHVRETAVSQRRLSEGCVAAGIHFDAARDRAQRRTRVRCDREIANASALFDRIWWDVRPPSAKIDTHRRPRDYLSHCSGRARILRAARGAATSIERREAEMECEAPEVVHIVVAHAKGGGAWSPKLSHVVTAASPTLGQPARLLRPQTNYARYRSLIRESYADPPVEPRAVRTSTR